jgi:hypothetical protein
MNLYNIIPAIDGYKRLITGYGLLFLGIGGLFNAVGDCLMTLELGQCYAGLQAAWTPLIVALSGLGVIGFAHKQEKDSPSV